MIDPNDVDDGTELVIEIQTVYQDVESDPYVDEMEVVRVEEHEEDGVPIVDLYLDHYDDESGEPNRRLRFRGADPEYQQGRGSGEDMSWAQFSRDDFCNVRRLEADPATA